MAGIQLDAQVSPQGVRIGRFLFLGPSGSGKTTIAGHFIRDILQWPVDHIRSVAPPTKPTLSTLIRAPHIALSVTDREAQEATFARIWREASLPYDEGGSDIGLALDDSDYYFSQSGRTYGTDSLSEIVKLGREAGLSQVFVAQGSSSISKDLISNSSVVFMGRTVEPNLLDYARRYMRDVPEAEHVISNLQPFVFLIYAPTLDPKLQGLAKVVNGRIVVKPWQPEAVPEEGSPTSEESEEATTPDDDASTPDVERPSPTDTPPTSVESTTPSGAPTRSESPKPDAGTASPSSKDGS